MKMRAVDSPLPFRVHAGTSRLRFSSLPLPFCSPLDLAGTTAATRSSSIQRRRRRQNGGRRRQHRRPHTGRRELRSYTAWRHLRRESHFFFHTALLLLHHQVSEGTQHSKLLLLLVKQQHTTSSFFLHGCTPAHAVLLHLPWEGMRGHQGSGP